MCEPGAIDTDVDHHDLARQTNQRTWALLESRDDDELMVHAAHASAYHWRHAGGPAEAARAEWLVSHVYAVLGRGEPALAHARRSLAICEEEGFGDFDLAYGYEGVARAMAVLGEASAAAEWRAKAGAAGAAIADPEDRQLFESDLAAGPW